MKIEKYLTDKVDHSRQVWGEVEANYKVNKNLKACGGCAYSRISEVREDIFIYFCDNKKRMTNSGMVKWNGICDLYKHDDKLDNWDRYLLKQGKTEDNNG